MREYVKPMMDSEIFVANEYFSACGDENKVYKFECDAGKFLGSSVPGTVYADTNNNGKLDYSDENLTSKIWPEYHACGATHEAPTDDEFIRGFYNPLSIFPTQDVIIWTDGGTNVHCTTNLDMDSWETAKS